MMKDWITLKESGDRRYAAVLKSTMKGTKDYNQIFKGYRGTARINLHLILGKQLWVLM